MAQESTPNIQHTENKADLALRSGARVDPSTRGMSLSIPLASYSGRAGHGLPVAINYSSKVWRLDYRGTDPLPSGMMTWTAALFAEHSAAGWTSSLDVPRVEFTGMDQYYNRHGAGLCELCSEQGGRPEDFTPYYVKRINVHMPGGASHELRLDDRVYTASFSAEPFVGTFHSVDGSRMRFESNAGAESVLFMPDGSRYVFPPYNNGGDLKATRFVDRHGNTLSYDAQARQWTDTLNRPLANPLPEKPEANTETYFREKLVGGGESPTPYTFRWKYLADVLTPGIPAPRLHYPGSSTCGPNRYNFINSGDPRLFSSSGGTRVCNEQDHDGNSMLFNPVVLAEVVLPTGNSFRFTYTVYGEIDKVYLPTGGTESFLYSQIRALSYTSPPYNHTNRGVIERKVDAGGGAEPSVWTYTLPPTGEEAYIVRETQPDGTYTERWVHQGRNLDSTDNFVKYGFDDARAGMVYDERVYSPANVMLRRTLTKWETAGPTPGGHSRATRDPKVTKQVSILLDADGANALTATTVNRYEQASQPLNLTSTTQYGYDSSMDKTSAETATVDSFNPPDSLAIRTTQTAYLDDDAYFQRGLTGLPTSVTVWRGTVAAGAKASFVETRYDESAYAPLPCGATVGWGHPGSQALGDATTVRMWLNTTNSYLETHARYDACGNRRNVWDANGNESQIFYDDSFSDGAERAATFAYPTRTLTAIPDPDGSNGSNVALEARARYDFHTGRVVETADANGHKTSYSFTDDQGARDLLNRLRKVSLPDGGWTKYDYSNTPGDLFIRTRTAIDPGRNTDSYQYFDALARPTRAYTRDGSAPERTWVATKKQYDVMGRVREASSPVFISGDSRNDFTPAADKITTTLYDALGRAVTVTSPDGAVMTTSYGGNEVTGTDQAGRTRRSVSDALGRLIKVIEAPGVADYGYETEYEYDTLGKLSKVVQGRVGQTRQTRTFVYDSLSRLTSATNPESGTVSYEYEANGNLKRRTDGRGVVMNNTYDALNRVTLRDYSDTTPDVTYNYDAGEYTDAQGVTRAVVNALGRLTKVSSSVTTYCYTGYDARGRTKGSSQATDGQTYAMGYEYDLAGNLTSQTYPSGRVVTTGTDPAGRISQVASGPTTYASAFSYTAHGAAASMRLGNGLWEHTIFNSRLQPTEIGLGTSADDANTNSTKLKLTYDYGTTANNGNVLSQRIVVPGLDVTQSYAYDDVNRLRAAQETGGSGQLWKQVYKYDHFGNRTFDAGTTLPALPASLSDPISNPEVDPDTNRLKPNRIGDNQEYQYDAAGNLSRNPQGQTFAYDADNMQVSFNGGPNPAAGGASYAYDGNGRRVKKVTAAGTTVYVYDAGGVLVAEYSTEARQPGAGGTKYLTTDTLGSPRVITDEDGAVVSRHDYQPFGEELFVGRTGEYRDDGIEQQFTGQERDRESGLDYFDARYYSYTHGRFTSTDPLRESANPASPQSWNRYAYVTNNPLKYVDPTGMMQQPAPTPTPDDEQLPRNPGTRDDEQGPPPPIPPIVNAGGGLEKPDIIITGKWNDLWWREEDSSITHYNSPEQLEAATELYQAELQEGIQDSTLWESCKLGSTGNPTSATFSYYLAKTPLIGDVVGAAFQPSITSPLDVGKGATGELNKISASAAGRVNAQQRFVEAGIPAERAFFYRQLIRTRARSDASALVSKHFKQFGPN